MSERGSRLLETASGQISELIGLLSTRGEAALSLPCPGREKLGDGSVGACALHTADRYQRIAGFLQGHGEGTHDGDYRAENVDLQGLLERLSSGQRALSRLAYLTDEQLDSVPPASEMKFCDGQRTLEQVLTSLLRHQSHQVEGLKAAIV